MKTFRYKVRRTPYKPLPFGAINRENNTEILTGVINGAAASDIEERFSRALGRDGRVTGYNFREPVISPRNLPGQLEIDFVVTVGPLVYPFQIDGEYAHKGIGKKMDDARKDELVNEYMKQYAAQPVKRIDGQKLQSQEDADRLVKELL